MKWLFWILGIIVVLIGMLYILIFTTPGNAIVTPIVEKKLQEAIKLPVKLELFRLTYDHFEAVIVPTKNNRIECKGEYSIFSQSLSARYRADLNDLAALQPLTKQPLQGSFSTLGTIAGPLKTLKIKGESDLAGSMTVYRSDIIEYNPVSVTLSMRNANIADLLFIAKQPAFAEGALGIDANISLNQQIPEGTIHLNVADGSVDTAIMKHEYNVTLPKSVFSFNADGRFDAKQANYTLTLRSDLAQIDSAGTLVPEPLSADITYDFKIRELALFKPLTHAPFRGPLMLNGTLKGDNKKMQVIAASDLADSTTRLSSTLINFRPDTLLLKVNHLSMKKLLYTLGQPLYADADVSLDADLSQLISDKRTGTVALNMRQGIVDRAVVAKAFDWPLFKGTRFSLDLKSSIDGDHADSKLGVTSDLLLLHASPSRYTISKKEFTADYTAIVPDLGALYFLTKHPLRGSAEVKGDLIYANDLTLRADSAILGGTIRSTLKEGKLHADLNNIQTQKALYMLTYPEVFDARLNGDLDYMLLSKKGVMNATLSDGRFTKNSAFDLLRNYSNIDLYAERFKGDTTIHINDNVLDTDLALHSNRTSITSKHARIDSAAQIIDAAVHLNANNNPVDFRLSGKLDHPNVTVDAGKLIEREAGKQIKRLFNDLFKK